MVLGGYAYTLGGVYYIHLTMQAYYFCYICSEKLTLNGGVYYPPSSHSRYASLGTLARISSCFGRVAALKTVINRF